MLETSAERLEQVRQLEMLLQLSRHVSALDSLDAVLEALVAAASQEIGAEAGSLFVHDDDSGELYTQRSSDLGKREIRVMDDRGIVGAVYQSGVGEIVLDVYADPRFAREVDRQTGFTTRSILCVPVRNSRGERIGAVELLNKLVGEFDERDLSLLEDMTSQCAVTLQSMQLLDRMTRSRRREVEFLNLVSELTSELELGRLLGRVMGEATRMLDAERTTLFLNDEKTGELFSYIGDKLDTEIRFPNDIGIAGSVFTTGESIRIAHAYADLRFNPAFDRQTGFFTRSILCVPVFNKEGRAIGVTQALNKLGGPFTVEDESRLRAFTAQIAVGLENAKLFADVQAMKNYNESMLESMSNGVITFDEEGISQTCNAAAARILRREEADVIGTSSHDLLGDDEPLATRTDEAGRRHAHLRADDGRGAPRRRRNGVGERQRLATVGCGPSAPGNDGDDRGHLEREARQVDALPLHGPRPRRPAAVGRCPRGDPRRDRVGRDRALLGHPQLHHDRRAARAARHGRDAERLLRAHGRLHIGPVRHARQVHRRRDHGRVRPAGCRRGRRGPRTARRGRDDLQPPRVEPGARGATGALDRHGDRHQHGRWSSPATSAARSGWTTRSSATASTSPPDSRAPASSTAHGSCSPS